MAIELQQCMIRTVVEVEEVHLIISRESVEAAARIRIDTIYDGQENNMETISEHKMVALPSSDMLISPLAQIIPELLDAAEEQLHGNLGGSGIDLRGVRA